MKVEICITNKLLQKNLCAKKKKVWYFSKHAIKCIFFFLKIGLFNKKGTKLKLFLRPRTLWSHFALGVQNGVGWMGSEIV